MTTTHVIPSMYSYRLTQRHRRTAKHTTGKLVQYPTGFVAAEVEITLDVHATLPDEARENFVRDVTENCRTLKFTDYGFEEARVAVPLDWICFNIQLVM